MDRHDNHLNLWHIINEYSHKSNEIVIKRNGRSVDVAIYKTLKFLWIFSVRFRIKKEVLLLKSIYDQTIFSHAMDGGHLDTSLDFADYKGWVFSVFNRTNDKDDLTQAVMGLTGESSEIQENVKRFLYHGGKLDRVDMAMEMGDVLFYFTLLLIKNKLNLIDIINASRTKLTVRYPNGREGDNYIVDKNPTKEREAVENMLNAAQ